MAKSKEAEEIIKESQKFQEGMNNDRKDSKTIAQDLVEDKDYSKLELTTEINGSNILSFNTNINGKQILTIKSRYERERKRQAKDLAEYDDYYYMLMAELMTDVPMSKLLDLPVKDYNRIKLHVLGFLGEE